MTHQITEFLATLMAGIGIIVFLIAFLIVAIDAIEVYLKFRRHLLNGDFSKRKDRE